MANFKEMFPGPHVVLPVIHVETPTQTLRNAEIALRAGCDGAFLISMRGMNYQGLLEMHRMVTREYPGWWLGVNFLDLPAEEVFDKLDQTIGGVWVDNAKINEHLSLQADATRISTARLHSQWEGLYFGGVAFKYQEHVDHPEQAAKIATKFVDVVTTSGTKTGSAPDIAKISAMKQAMGNFPLGIASGISPENVHQYKGTADCFLTATSLLIPGTEVFDRNKVVRLVENVRAQ